jgi:hypothetical protein
MQVNLNASCQRSQRQHGQRLRRFRSFRSIAMGRAQLDGDIHSLSYERSPGYRQRLRLNGNGTNSIQDGKFRFGGSVVSCDSMIEAFGSPVEAGL